MNYYFFYKKLENKCAHSTPLHHYLFCTETFLNF